jgi:integrase
MGAAEVGAFLTHLATRRNLPASTQNQALNALNVLYGAVIGRELGTLHGVVRAKPNRRIPVVLIQLEVAQIPDQRDGTGWLLGCLLYGSGLRLMEGLRLRVKDLAFAHRAVVVRHGKGGKDRVVTLPDELVRPLRRQLAAVREMFGFTGGFATERNTPRISEGAKFAVDSRIKRDTV